MPSNLRRIVLAGAIILSIGIDYAFSLLILAVMLAELRGRVAFGSSMDIRTLRRALLRLLAVSLSALSLIFLCTGIFQYSYSGMSNEGLQRHVQLVLDSADYSAVSPAALEYFFQLTTRGYIEEALTLYWSMNVSSLIFLVFVTGAYGALKLSCWEIGEYNSAGKQYRWATGLGYAIFILIFIGAAWTHYDDKDLFKAISIRQSLRVVGQQYDYYRITAFYALGIFAFVMPLAVPMKLLSGIRSDRRE